MKKRKNSIFTNNREIYEKFNLLHFSNEVVLRDVTKRQIGKILSNINRIDNVLEVDKIGEYLLVRRKKPINFNVYLR